jgi:hypothetical protein
MESPAIYSEAAKSASAVSTPAFSASATAVTTDHPEDEEKDVEKQKDSDEEEEAPIEMEGIVNDEGKKEVSSLSESSMGAARKQCAQLRPRINKNQKQRGHTGKKAANEVYSAIAQESNSTIKNVEKVLKGLQDVGVRLLKMSKMFRVPNMVIFKQKTVPARAHSTKSIFGKELLLTAKPATKKLTASVLQPFKTQTLSC